MDRSANIARLLRRTLCLFILGICCFSAGSVQAAQFFITISGTATKNYYFDPYSDPSEVDTPGPYSTTLSFEFPFLPSEDPVNFPIGYDYYYTDPALGQLHGLFYPGYAYCCDGTRYTFGHRSLSYYFTTSEGTDFSIDITSLTDIFPTIDQLSPIDIDIGPATGSTGSFSGRFGYYKEPQYGLLEGFVTHLSIAVVPSVPEPSSWALMVLGFGAIGIGLRRRKMVPVMVSGRAA